MPQAPSCCWHDLSAPCTHIPMLGRLVTLPAPCACWRGTPAPQAHLPDGSSPCMLATYFTRGFASSRPGFVLTSSTHRSRAVHALPHAEHARQVAAALHIAAHVRLLQRRVNMLFFQGLRLIAMQYVYDQMYNGLLIFT